MHLDDTDPKMQLIIFELLKATLLIDVPRVARKAFASRPSHLNPVGILVVLADTASRMRNDKGSTKRWIFLVFRNDKAS